MRLPIPIFYKDKFYTDIEVQKPKASVLAEASNSIQNERIFAGLLIFLKGSIISISDGENLIEDSISIKSILPKMAYRSAENTSMQIMIKQYNGQDGVEGIYQCPLCNHKIICQLQKMDGMEIDTRDFISQLNIEYQEEPKNSFIIDLKEPVIIRDKRNNEILEEVSTLEMEYPTLEHCMNAEIKYGHRNEMKLQFGIYANALKSINGEEIDNKYRNMIGITIFENIADFDNDLRSLSENNSMYGIDPRVEKQCPECGKVWQPKLNTSSFFVSALRLN